MNDYEVEALIDYELREDDPEYDDTDDNPLASREENFNCTVIFDPDQYWCELLPGQESAVYGEPHCRLFYDLYHNHYGGKRRSLSFQDCLRIGKIFIDVQVQQQYCFDLEKGEWIKSWRLNEKNDTQG